jgi:hypothetical protein
MSSFPLPNYTPLPNYIVDNGWLQKLSHAEYNVFTVIIRFTTGYHRREAYISYNTFEKLSGVSRRWVVECTKKLIELGCVEVETGGPTSTNLYRIIYNAQPSEERDSNNDGVVYSDPEGSVVGAKGVVYSAPPIKKELKKKKENNNRRQPPPDPKPEVQTRKRPPSSAAAVFSILEDLDIPQREKEWITRNHTEKEVTHALAWITHPKTIIKTSFIQIFKWACGAQPEMPLEKIDVALKHKSLILRLFKGIEGKTFDWGAKAYIGPTYIDIGNGTHPHRVFEFEKASCVEQLLSFIREKVPSMYQVIDSLIIKPEKA